MIGILIVDDHASFRQPLAFMLERESDFTVVRQAGSLAEARPRLEHIDVAVIDIDLPDGSGIDLIHELHVAQPHSQILVLTASASRKELAQAIEAGAAGLLHKSASIEEIISAVRRLGAGEFLLDPRDVIEMLRLAHQAQAQDREVQEALRQLTTREREVLQALAAGMNDKQIACHLYISVETVRTHMVNIFTKLKVDSRLQALVFAVRHGAVKIS